MIYIYIYIDEGLNNFVSYTFEIYTYHNTSGVFLWTISLKEKKVV